MKYMNNGGFQQHPMMRTTILLTLTLLLGFAVVNILLFLDKMGPSPASVTAYYLGDEESFRPARSYASMLEVTHMHLPMMAVVMLLLTHLVIFTPLTNRWKYAFIITAFTAAMSNELAGYLIRFVDPSFAWLKLTAFITLEACLFLLVLILSIFLLHRLPAAAKESALEQE